MLIRYISFLYAIALAATTPCYGVVDFISVSGNPGTMTIATATAGSQPDSVTDNTTTYSITTLLASSITAVLSANMPTGVTLSLNMAAPTGAVSQGTKNLSTTPQTMVSSIPLISLLQTKSITYTLSVTVNAATATGNTATVTLTLQ